MKKKVKLVSALLFIGFLMLFGFKMLYEFRRADASSLDVVRNIVYESASYNGISKVKQNIASYKAVVKDEYTSKTVTVDQKYEKIANLASGTTKFNDDEKVTRDVIKEYNAIIQFENNIGVEGNRSLELSIGIHPDKFDEFVSKLKGIGILSDFRVDKIDKTSEYKDLKARQIALEKTRTSLISLKEKGGSIGELIELENRIMDMEERIQGFGIQLGDFAEENELCTVKFTLREKQSKAEIMNVLKIVFKSLLWAAGVYIAVIILAIITILCAYLLLVLIDKGRQVYSNFGRANNL